MSFFCCMDVSLLLAIHQLLSQARSPHTHAYSGSHAVSTNRYKKSCQQACPAAWWCILSCRWHHDSEVNLPAPRAACPPILWSQQGFCVSRRCRWGLCICFHIFDGLGLRVNQTQIGLGWDSRMRKTPNPAREPRASQFVLCGCVYACYVDAASTLFLLSAAAPKQGLPRLTLLLLRCLFLLQSQVGANTSPTGTASVQTW